MLFTEGIIWDRSPPEIFSIYEKWCQKIFVKKIFFLMDTPSRKGSTARATSQP